MEQIGKDRYSLTYNKESKRRRMKNNATFNKAQMPAPFRPNFLDEERIVHSSIFPFNRVTKAAKNIRQ